MDSLVASKPWLINAFHVLVAAFLFWIGYTRGKNVPAWVFDALAAAAVLIALYHIYLGYQKTQTMSSFVDYY